MAYLSRITLGYVTLKRGGDKSCRNIVKFDELKKNYEIGYP